MNAEDAVPSSSDRPADEPAADKPAMAAESGGASSKPSAAGREREAPAPTIANGKGLSAEGESGIGMLELPADDVAAAPPRTMVDEPGPSPAEPKPQRAEPGGVPMGSASDPLLGRTARRAREAAAAEPVPSRSTNSARYMVPSEPIRALVTGGAGFLGSAIRERLRKRGDSVRTASRGHYPNLEIHGIEHIRGDLADPDVVDRAVGGAGGNAPVDVIFHVAAKAGVWGPREAFHRANVVATEHLLAAAKRHGVERFVFTSSPSVVFAMQDEVDIDESAPYADRYYAAYPETKAIAEKMVLAANAPGELLTVALRPHLIVGPGDPHIVPRIIKQRLAGKLKRVGDGRNRVSMTDVDDAARAHLFAEHELRRSGSGAACAGRAYFINQGQAVTLWEWVDEILERSGLPKVKGRVSYRFAYAVGAIAERLGKLLGRKKEPAITRFMAAQFARHHTHSILAAQQDLSYMPKRSMTEVTDRVVQYIRDEKHFRST